MQEREVQLDLDKAKEHIALLPDEDVRQIVKQAGNWADYQRMTSLMNGIAAEIREGKDPDSLVNPSDSFALQKVEFPPEGGVLTYMASCSYPYRGYPHFNFVERIDAVKKLNRATLSGLFHEFKSVPRWKMVTLLPSIWAIKHGARTWIHAMHRMIARFLIKPLRLSQSVREVHRAFSVGYDKEVKKEIELRTEIRDILCMLLELDNAYRFRFQDLIPEINKQELKRNPGKELVRLFTLAQERENQQEIRDTWTLAKLFVKWYFLIDKKMLRLVQRALLELNLEKVALDIGDKFFCIPRKDYTFKFMQSPNDAEQEMIERHQRKVVTDEKIAAIRKESDAEHQKLLARHRQEEPNLERQSGEIKSLDEKYEQQLKQVTNPL